MHKRLISALVLMVIVTLACNISNEETYRLSGRDQDNIKVQGVMVTPSSGSGTFTLQVTYEAYREVLNNYAHPTVHCMYTAPDGATMKIGNTEPTVKTAKVWIPFTETFVFNVQQQGGRTKPGTYLAGCTTSYNDPPVTTTFTVIGVDATPTEISAADLAITTITPTALALTWGRLTYDNTSNQQGFNPDQFHKWCDPSLTIDANGTISGTCSSSQDPVDLGLYGTWFGAGSSIEGKVTGTLVPGGSFIFREELTETYSRENNAFWSTRAVVIEGTGTFVSTTQATGSATYSAECKASSPDISHCGIGSAYDFFTGTINWEFNGSTQ